MRKKDFYMLFRKIRKPTDFLKSVGFLSTIEYIRRSFRSISKHLFGLMYVILL